MEMTTPDYLEGTGRSMGIECCLTMLVAEDSEEYAMFMKLALKEAGQTNLVHFVEDGEEAISYLEGTGRYGDRRSFPFPDVLFLDLKMPGMDGFDVLRWMKAHPNYRVIPTMVLSSSVLETDVTQAYALGANAYLGKPADLNDLKAMLGDACRFWKWSARPERSRL